MISCLCAGFALAALPGTPVAAPALSSIENGVWGQMDEWMVALISMSIAFVVAVVLGAIVGRLMRALARAGHLPLAMAHRLRRLFWWLMAFVFATVVLQNTHLFEQAWAVLSAMLVALAVAFVAMWSVLSNTICALLILAFRPFRLGDNVEILEPSDNKAGISGRVTDLSLMFTTLEGQEQDGNRVLCRVPNSVFFQKAVRVSFPADADRGTFFGVPQSDAQS